MLHIKFFSQQVIFYLVEITTKKNKIKWPDDWTNDQWLYVYQWQRSIINLWKNVFGHMLLLGYDFHIEKKKEVPTFSHTLSSMA